MEYDRNLSEDGKGPVMHGTGTNLAPLESQ